MAETLAKSLKTNLPVVPTSKPMNAGERYEMAIAGPLEELGRAKQEQAEFASQEKEDLLRREADRAKAKATATRAQASAVRNAPESGMIKSAEEELMSKEFIPTADTAQDLAGLFSLLNVIGFAIGKGGKQNAQLAMNSMNGMLEGYQKGRSDLYKKEKSNFETNFKALKTKVDVLRSRLKDIAELSAVDAKAGDQEADVLFAEQGADFLKQHKNKYGLPATIDFLEKIVGAKGKSQEIVLKEEAEARKEAAAERRHRESEVLRQRANELAERRIALQEERLRKGEGGKPLKESELSKIEGLQSLSKDLEKLKKDFKDEYASLGLLGLGADLSFEAKRRLGDEEGRKAVQWWSKYERLQAPNRHALFGATLTGNELENYRSFTAKKSDSPDIVRNMLQDQSDYARGTAESRALSYESAGYKVPEIRQPRSFVDTYSGSSQAAPAQRPVPTDADRERGRSNPASRENFIRHFGEEP